MKRAGRIPTIKHPIEYYAKRYVKAGLRRDKALRERHPYSVTIFRRRQQNALQMALEVGYSRQDMMEAVRDIELNLKEDE